MFIWTDILLATLDTSTSIGNKLIEINDSNNDNDKND